MVSKSRNVIFSDSTKPALHSVKVAIAVREGLGWGIISCIGVFRALNNIKSLADTHDYSSKGALEECIY